MDVSRHITSPLQNAKTGARRAPPKREQPRVPVSSRRRDYHVKRNQGTAYGLSSKHMLAAAGGLALHTIFVRIHTVRIVGGDRKHMVSRMQV